MATGSLLAGSILTFDKEELPDYFYLVGTSLFFMKALLCLVHDCINTFKQNKHIYKPIV